MEDASLLYVWRNHPTTRAMMFDSKPVSWKEHLQWLRNVMEDSSRRLFIARRAGLSLGTVRYDVEGGEAFVSVTVAPGHRGCGVGAEILRLGNAEMQKVGVKTIKAVIKTENTASQKAFAQAGYAETRRTETEVTMTCQMISP